MDTQKNQGSHAPGKQGQDKQAKPGQQDQKKSQPAPAKKA